MRGPDIFALLGIQMRAQRQFGHPQDAVHGCPDLVAHVGQEFAPRLSAKFRPMASPLHHEQRT